MAIYEYRCKKCDNRFEAMRQMRDMNAPAPCPKCQSLETMRQLSLFAAHSGSGSKSGASAAGSCATSEALNMPCCGGMCGLK